MTITRYTTDRCPGGFGCWRRPLAVLALVAASVALGSTPGLAQEASRARRADIAVRLILQPYGFEQPTITVPTGAVHFTFDNRTYATDLQLTLSRETGGEIRSTRVDRTTAKWRDVVDLAPGEYVVRVVGEPKWTVRLTVNPPGKGFTR